MTQFQKNGVLTQKEEELMKLLNPCPDAIAEAQNDNRKDNPHLSVPKYN